MLIDWFTVFAQIINFLILIFLLHRFLYKPIVKTIKSRQQEIEHRWQEAEKKKEAAQAEAASYRQKQQELEVKKQEFLDRAQEQGEEKYHQLLQQARQEVEQKQVDWENALAQQQEQFLENLQQKIAEQVYQIACQALQELADISLEQQAIATFIHRLETLDEEKQQSLSESLSKSNNGIVIRSSFELSADTRQKILDSLHCKQIYPGNNLQFTTTPDLICGIELQASDYKVAWNLKSYLQSLEENFVRENKLIINNK
ncbi:MAG: F0F1 ATP synthase subunit B [Pleurocapsa sp.]